MKRLFISVVAVMVATMSFAQNTLVATLSHGNEVKMFYGSYALREAHDAAVSGDMINLSGGSFQSVNITKAVTLRGAGIENATPTYIINDFEITIPSTEKGRFSMEGIRVTNVVNIKGNLSNPYFLKCHIYVIECYQWEETNVTNGMFCNCIITGHCRIRGNSTFQFVNCFLQWFDNPAENSASASFINCIVRDADYSKSSQFVNCILFAENAGSGRLPSTSVATNCVSVNFEVDFFENSPSSSGCMIANFDELFTDFSGGSYKEGQNYKLTADAKTKFLGTDGKEVGLYGGILPYDPTPSYPQITKMNVSNKTTADGKLSVEIEVKAAQ